MSRFLRAALLLVLLASCGGAPPPPRNIENACAIITERPKYYSAMQKAAKRWGVPVHIQMATIYAESRFKSDARTPHQFALGIIPMGRQSSAYGYSQALDGTWDQYRAETGRRGAKRDDIRDATDFMGWYFDQSARKLGLSKTDARNQYLAYHEGHAGYARGSYNEKAWLVRVADGVADRSLTYAVQLSSCRRR